ncbi:hypothetical protein [Mesorhizobium sp.]|uniref:hypothetical protein n=1 Tax=Mesorhizobium sp. TaxID=1871066 RepID=UPI000FEAA72F|nr:hypothetical protein [Mesorhizobium sp.]RWP02742.1 MAG: hypothetical protein EOQ99_22965 [Mesorhizobium sp.]
MTPVSADDVLSVVFGWLSKNSDRLSASSMAVKRIELTVDGVGIVVESTGVRSVRLTSKIANTVPDNELEIRDLLGENLLYCVSVQVALCADQGGALLIWADIDNVYDDWAVVREQMVSFCNAAIYWNGICRRHRSINQSPLSKQNCARAPDVNCRNDCDSTGGSMDGKDLNGTMVSARQTIAQVESFLGKGREQLRRQTELLGDYAMTGDVISAFVEDQHESFRQAYTCERQAFLRDSMTLTSNQQPVRAPRVKPMRQRV